MEISWKWEAAFCSFRKTAFPVKTRSYSTTLMKFSNSQHCPRSLCLLSRKPFLKTQKHHTHRREHSASSPLQLHLFLFLLFLSLSVGLSTTDTVVAFPPSLAVAFPPSSGKLLFSKMLLFICLDFLIWGWEEWLKEGWEERRDECMGVGKKNWGWRKQAEHRTMAGKGMLFLSLFFLESLFLCRFMRSLGFLIAGGKRGRACVVVLGDIGRSPRMQYHALSLARLVSAPAWTSTADLATTQFLIFHFVLLKCVLKSELLFFHEKFGPFCDFCYWMCVSGFSGGRYCCIWRYIFGFDCRIRCIVEQIWI